jgi:pyruvate formate lyase activating enzyme
MALFCKELYEDNNVASNIYRKWHGMIGGASKQSRRPVETPSTVQVLNPSLWRAEGHALRCLACARHCLLHNDTIGFCTAIAHREGALYSTAYGVVGEVSVTPIENRPVYHYRPGSRTLCLGGLGCNLRCAFCQNWEVAFRDARHGGGLSSPNLPPERVIELALEQGCDGIAWTFNEPSISPMYTLDCARLAHEAGLYTVFVTNGMMTHEALDLLGPHLDVYRVDVKSLDQDFYQHVAGTAHISDIFPVARRAQQEFGIHVEAVTNLMPSLNDSDTQLTRLAEQIISQLGADTPWHLTSYVPYAHMKHIPPTSPETLSRACAIGKNAGLRFVYTDNPAAQETANTYCPDCGMLVIERIAHRVTLRHLGTDGSCASCEARLGIVLAPCIPLKQKGISQ